VEISDDDALSFDDLGTNPFSIAAWIYVTHAGVAQRILVKDNSGIAREWSFQLKPDSKLALFLFDDSAGTYATRDTDDVLTVGWHFVAATYDSTGGATAANGITLYVEGAVVDSTAHNNIGGAYTAMEDTATKVTIGASYISGVLGKYFTDKIDNVKIFDKVLSQAEITALYSEGL